MTHNWKKKTAGLLAAVLLAVCLAGCNVNAVSQDPTDPTDPSVAQTTDPTTEPTKPEPSISIDQPVGPNIIGTAELKQLRLSGYDGNWVERFTNQFGDFTVINDAAALADAFAEIARMGRELALPENYDDAFFAENYLVLIPRGSNSGSVRYVADAVRDGNKITITVEGKMPDVGTTDMADWLLLVMLPRDKFPENLPIEVNAPEAQGIGVKDNLDITDR